MFEKLRKLSYETKIILSFIVSCILCFFIGFYSNPLFYRLFPTEEEKELIAELNSSQVENYKMELGTYTGGLYNGKRTGWGRLVTNKGNVYEGDWINNLLPQGTMDCDFGHYDGEFGKSLSPHGWGLMNYGDSIYAGTWFGGNKQGIGRIIKSNGDISIAYWNNGRPSQQFNRKCNGRNVYGIDVSKYQAKMDWNNMAIYADANGIPFAKDPENEDYMLPVTFVYIKATQAAGRVDPFYEQHDREAKRHLIIKGAYHFFDFHDDIEAQINNFLSHVHYEKGDLPPALDIEVENQLGKNSSISSDVNKMRSMIIRWITEVRRELGVTPAIYTSDKFYTDYLKNVDELKMCDIWIARYYNKKPNNDNWTLWQATDMARLPGMEGVNHIDINTFNGNLDDFYRHYRIPNMYPYTKNTN